MRFSTYLGWFCLLIFLLTACSPAGFSDQAPTAVSEPTDTVRPEFTPAPELQPTTTAPTVSTPEPEPTEDFLPPLYRLTAGELTLAADIDAIPAIFASDDLFVDAAAGSQEWLDDELVIAVQINGDARAYPVRLLSLHEIVNDVVGGQPVAVTWCPLCFSALVFDRVVERELTFGVSGFLFKENLVMYDHQTNTLWSQLLAQGIKGGLRGERLALIPSVITSWGEWKSANPTTRVLSAEQMGRSAAEIVDPYAGYYTAGGAGLTSEGAEDKRLASKALVVGLVSDKDARAYPLQQVAEEKLINDRLADMPLLIAFHPDLEAVLVFRALAGEQELAFELDAKTGFIRDRQTGSLWEISTGRAVEGQLEGARLARLSAPLVFWFAWSDLHPSTDVYAP